jgi:dTDP-4-dehydrorhamnose 3,5-epimerase-like enzyme
MPSGLDRARLIELPKIGDHRGFLTVAENNRQVPFDIRRVYYLYDLPENTHRGGHAHKLHEELVLPLAGSFDVTLDDGQHRKTFHLDQPNIGLFMPTMVWHELANFATGSVCMVLASQPHDAEDYYRDREEFYRAVRG